MTWQVTRAQFDLMLIEHAAEQGCAGVSGDDGSSGCCSKASAPSVSKAITDGRLGCRVSGAGGG